MTVSGKIAVVVALLGVSTWSCGGGRTESEERIDRAKEVLSVEIGVPIEEIEVVEAERMTWADSSLGCPEPGMMYAQGVVDGYRIVLSVAGTEYPVHSGETGDPVVCRPGGLENGSFFADLDGRQVHYEVHGQGPVLMVVPNSWGLDIVGLRGMLGGLEDVATMVYFDPRGMGQSGPVRDESDMSMAAVRHDFDALREELGLERVHAIGWSNGAGNLILLASEHPETLESAIFVHGVASYTQEDAVEFSEKYPDLAKGFMAFMQEMADESLTDEVRTERMKELWMTEFFPTSMADPETGQALIDEAFGDAQFSWAHGQVANQESMAGFDMREQLAAIPVRSLVIAGSHDMSTPEKVRELADGLPDSVYVLFENSGHFAPLEEPERFEATVLEFLGPQ